MNGALSRDARSVSSTVHDRKRPTTVVESSSNSSRRQSSPKPQRHSNRHPSGSSSGPSSHTHPGTSPHQVGTAKETFLNYFFGQNGPGPLAGSSIERGAHGGNSVSLVGRDISGGDSSLQTGLMAGKRTLEGSNAAFDMKSLGKHIEAVSFVCLPFRLSNLLCSAPRLLRDSPSISADHNIPLLLQYRRQTGVHKCQFGRKWRRTLFAPSSRPTSASFARRFKTSCRKLSCISSSTTRRNRCRID